MSRRHIRLSLWRDHTVFLLIQFGDEDSKRKEIKDRIRNIHMKAISRLIRHAYRIHATYSTPGP